MGNLSGLFVDNSIVMLLLGFAVVILLLMIRQHLKQRKCPKCAEQIANEAKICKHCKTEL